MHLEQIVSSKIREVASLEAALPLGVLASGLGTLEKPRNFQQSLQEGKGLKIIAEVKRASPVKGLLCSDFDLKNMVSSYQQGGADAISVITEKYFFKGDPEYVGQVKKITNLPVLRKDFIISEYQVFESRVIGADAILLIVSIIDQYMLRRLIKLATNLGLGTLVEVHDKSELERAVSAGAKVIGVNNRNLKNFTTNLSNTLVLAADIPDHILLVSESGINNREDIVQLERAGVNAALIGEALVRSADPCIKLKGLKGLLAEKGAGMQCG